MNYSHDLFVYIVRSTTEQMPVIVRLHENKFIFAVCVSSYSFCFTINLSFARICIRICEVHEVLKMRAKNNLKKFNGILKFKMENLEFLSKLLKYPKIPLLKKEFMSLHKNLQIFDTRDF